MLVIRMQRTGRKGHAQFRIVVQDSRRTPTSGKVVAMLGSYDPHAKTTTLNKEKASVYLNNGAQPSERVARLLQSEGVELPKWVKIASPRTGTIRNPEKLRRNQPKEEVPAEEPTEEPSAEVEAPADTEAPADAPEAETGTTES